MRPCDDGDGDPIAMLAKWYKTPLGRQVAAAEGICLERLLADAFGPYLVQFGCAGQFGGIMATTRIRQRVVLGETPCAQAGDTREDARIDAQIQASPYLLPLAAASVDAVLLPHTLDFCRDPHRVLREVERVLIAEGRLYVLCFNPLSAWGLLRALPRRRRRVPWCGGQLSPLRIADWLRLLGFQIDERQMLVFRPPMTRARSARADWMERIGGRYWPLLGGVYVLSAVKRVTAMTPLRPRWSKSAGLLPGGALKPTARQNTARQNERE